MLDQEQLAPGEGMPGVFIGMQQMEYGNLAAAHLHKMGPFTATGGPFSVAAGRLSYTFGLRGPAVSGRCLMLPW